MEIPDCKDPKGKDEIALNDNLSNVATATCKIRPPEVKKKPVNYCNATNASNSTNSTEAATPADATPAAGEEKKKAENGTNATNATNKTKEEKCVPKPPVDLTYATLALAWKVR